MKTKSGRVAVFRPSLRSKSCTLWSARQMSDKYGTLGRKCATTATSVTKTQIPPRISSRCRFSQCTSGLYQIPHRFVIPHLSFVVFQLPFALRTDSEGLSTCPVPPWREDSSASEVGKIDKLNEQRAERGVSERSGTNNKCQEPLMRRPAVRDANASSNPPKVIAVADQNSSVTPKTQP